MDGDLKITFEYSEAYGLGYEPGITRRDPSCIILAGGQFHVWYTRTPNGPSGYDATVWHATSTDGIRWEEQGEALSRGGAGDWDEQCVFTPNILVAEGRYFLFYTSVEKPYSEEALTAIGVAYADSPAGPWTKGAGNPVLGTGSDIAWDSHRVDDSCLVVRDGRYWLYYKGRQKGLSPRETRMGLAVAEGPLGPYRKAEENPLVEGGHEVCVWRQGTGVAALVQPNGPEGGTLRYSEDGIHFRSCAVLRPPQAPGPYRADFLEDEPQGAGIEWGLHINLRSRQLPFLERFTSSELVGDWHLTH
ncbi:MAG: family 43 glycosylhydrolase [Caldilineaceae bacterium]|nr:family 43 glycosylhydrolase [Caldilineaceae bacterium]